MNKWIICFATAFIFLMVEVAFAGTIQLPKTGQTKCYDSDGNEIMCAGTGQDGEIQAGVAWPDPRFTDNSDGTMTDNLTGLMWTKDANLPGGTTDWQLALDYANSLTLAGYSDWRLPNVNELESLVNGAEANTAAWLNAQGFTNVQADSYWSSTTYAPSTDDAWIVNMWFGYVHAVFKSSYYVWPVRSGQCGSLDHSVICLPKTGQTKCYNTSGGEIPCADTGQDGEIQAGVARPDPGFTDHGDGTITDNLTGLMWTKNANLTGGTTNWQQALDYANNLTLAGHSDWRLPNRKELHSLQDFSRYNTALPAGHPFTNVRASYYWSSTAYTLEPVYAWFVDMWNGYVHYGSKSSFVYVWPVRGGQLLTLIKQVDKLFAGTGNELTYTLTYRNLGKKDATNVVIEDTLPTDLELVEGSISNGGTYDPEAKRITWNIGSLPIGGDAQTVTLKAKVVEGTADGTKIVNTARISSTEQTIATISSVTTTIGSPSITNISPNNGGNAGTVTVTIKGTNLDPSAQVKLIKTGEAEIIGTGITGSSAGTQLTATFDLVGRLPGICDVVVINPGGQTSTLSNAFTIESGGEAKLWVEIVGSDRIRVGRTSTFTVRYGNAGNIDATYPWLAIGLPQNVPNNVDIPWALPHVTPEEPSDSNGIKVTLINLPPLATGQADSINVYITPSTAGSVKVQARITEDPDTYFQSMLSLPDVIHLATSSDIPTSLFMKKASPDEYPQIDMGLTPPPGYVMMWDLRQQGVNNWEFHIAKSVGDGKFIEMTPSDSGPDLRISDTLATDRLSVLSPSYEGALRPPLYTEQHGQEIQEMAQDLIE